MDRKELMTKWIKRCMHFDISEEQQDNSSDIPYEREKPVDNAIDMNVFDDKSDINSNSV